MKRAEGDELPDVSTDAQRQALDAMSRNLVENLNTMVREQRERAERFAAMQHSLSPLPGQAEAHPLSVEEAAPSAAAKPRSKPQLPPRPGTRLEPQSFNSPELRLNRPRRPVREAAAPAKKEKGCGAFPTIVFIIILLIIIRSCSA